MARSIWHGVLLGAGSLLAVQAALLAAALGTGALPITVAVATPAASRGARAAWGPLVAHMDAPVIDGVVQQLVGSLPVTVAGVRLHLPHPAQMSVARRLDARVARQVEREVSTQARRPRAYAGLLKALNAWLAQCTLRLGLGWRRHVWLPVRVHVVPWAR